MSLDKTDRGGKNWENIGAERRDDGAAVFQRTMSPGTVLGVVLSLLGGVDKVFSDIPICNKDLDSPFCIPEDYNKVMLCLELHILYLEI